MADPLSDALQACDVKLTRRTQSAAAEAWLARTVGSRRTAAWPAGLQAARQTRFRQDSQAGASVIGDSGHHAGGVPALRKIMLQDAGDTPSRSRTAPFAGRAVRAAALRMARRHPWTL